MEELFITLQRMAAESLPEISLIDEDYGQLQALLNGEDTYVLIGDVTAEWKNATPLAQQGQATVTVRLAFDCYDDTHYGSGTEGKIRERLQTDNRLYKTLQGFRIDRNMGRLARKKTAHYSLPGGIKVYETVYGFDLVDQSAAPDRP